MLRLNPKLMKSGIFGAYLYTNIGLELYAKGWRKKPNHLPKMLELKSLNSKSDAISGSTGGFPPTLVLTWWIEWKYLKGK